MIRPRMRPPRAWRIPGGSRPSQRRCVAGDSGGRCGMTLPLEGGAGAGAEGGAGTARRVAVGGREQRAPHNQVPPAVTPHAGPSDTSTPRASGSSRRPFTSTPAEGNLRPFGYVHAPDRGDLLTRPVRRCQQNARLHRRVQPIAPVGLGGACWHPCHNAASEPSRSRACPSQLPSAGMCSSATAMPIGPGWSGFAW